MAGQKRCTVAVYQSMSANQCLPMSVFFWPFVRAARLPVSASVLVLALFATLAPTLRAQSSEEDAAPHAATMEPGIDAEGASERVANPQPFRGMQFGAAMTADGFANVAGGAARGRAMLYSLDVTLALDGEALFGWSGSTAFAYVLATRGESPSQFVGDMQAVSNIDAPPVFRLYEAWLDQALFGDRLSVRGGIYDLNSEFYVVESASVLLNASHGIGPEVGLSGVNGPSIFPLTALALRLRFAPTPRHYLQAAAFDGVPAGPDAAPSAVFQLLREEGALLALEGGWTAPRRAPIRLAAGGWVYTRPSVKLGGDGTARSFGAYGIAEARLYSKATHPSHGLDAFARVGWAHAAVNAVPFGWGAGLVSTGWLPGRPHDRTALAVAAAHGGRPSTMSISSAELVVELTHELELMPGVTVQPNVQYVIGPGMQADHANAWVLALRVAASI